MVQMKAKFVALIALTVASGVPAHAQPLPGGFVYLRDIDPTIIQDIRYATSNNFVGHPMVGYRAGECVVKREVALRLKAIQQELARRKLSLKMFDCYRPARATADMLAWSRDGKDTGRRFNPAFNKRDLFRLGYISPYSQHSTGAALDLTLVDLTADNSATFDPAKTYLRQARPGGQHRHGHRLRLHGSEGPHQFERDHCGAAQMAPRAGGCDGAPRFCQLLAGMVALLPAGRGRTGL
jgi:D-alanyl-D-alanine dipeptidase